MPMARVGAGIRNRPCHAQDVCADCCSLDPGWASINRGILICDECCSVHRSLGRHISHVKSLIKGSWHPSELAMVHSLSSSGANHIWEHTLLDPSNVKSMRRKPQAKEPVHPNKADFIRAKHQMMSFVYKPSKEDISAADKDVSCQLHASVRTHNLEISLRLLSQGADPNYFHKEKGNSPLHVAARAGQESQVELLAIYGADPGAPDRDGKTPVDYAREGGFHDIAVRLIELQYELPDRLAFYLCGYKPDHNNGQHWVIPQMADTTESQEVAKEARSRLISLPNHSFEELACDVYDEVDRRETDAIFLPTQNQSALLSDRCSVPFLPVNPEFSSVRNQGRQKLARFNDREFATLIIDILIEIRRKMIGHSYVLETDKDSNDSTLTPQINIPFQHSQIPTNSELGKISTSISDKGNHTFRQTCPSNTAQYGSNSFINTTFNTAQSYPSLTNKTHTTHIVTRPKDSLYDDEPLYDSVASEDDYSSWDRRQKIRSQQEVLQSQSRTKIQDVDYQEVEESPEGKSVKVVDSVAATVSIEEYLDMKRYLELSETKIKELQDNNIIMSAKLNELSTVVHSLKEENDNLRAQSQRSSPHFPSNHGTPSHRNYTPYYDSPSHSHNFQNGECVPQSPRLSESGIVASSSATSINRQVRPCSMFESRGRNNTPNNSFSATDSFHQHYGSYESQSLKSIESSTENLPRSAGLPTQEEVVRKTEVITKRIQELLLSAQDSQHDRFIPCSEHISKAVKEMADIFPKEYCSVELWNAIQQLVQSAARLQFECRNHVNSQLHILDPGRVTQQVIQCAYDIAKAAKVLVTHFQ